MSKSQLSDNHLQDQSTALQSYLQELLNAATWAEVPDTDPVDQSAESTQAETVNAASEIAMPDSSQQQAAMSDELVQEPVNQVILTEVVVEDEVIEKTSDENIGTRRKVQTLADLEAQYDSDDTPLEDTLEPVPVPDWATGSFQALMATHDKIRLLLPLVHVQTVLKAREMVRVENPLTPFVGYVRKGSRRIPVIDLNRLHGFSDNSDTDDTVNEAEKPAVGYVAVAEDHSVGLFFSKIEDTREVISNEISWRCRDDLATWMAGVDPQNLSIVVDIGRVGDLL